MQPALGSTCFPCISPHSTFISRGSEHADHPRHTGEDPGVKSGRLLPGSQSWPRVEPRSCTEVPLLSPGLLRAPMEPGAAALGIPSHLSMGRLPPTGTYTDHLGCIFSSTLSADSPNRVEGSLLLSKSTLIPTRGHLQGLSCCPWARRRGGPCTSLPELSHRQRRGDRWSRDIWEQCPEPRGMQSKLPTSIKPHFLKSENFTETLHPSAEYT